MWLLIMPPKRMWHLWKHKIWSRAVIVTFLLIVPSFRTVAACKCWRRQRCDRSCLHCHSDRVVGAPKWWSHSGCLNDRWRYLPDQSCLLLWWVLTYKAAGNDTVVGEFTGYINIWLKMRLSRLTVRSFLLGGTIWKGVQGNILLGWKC